MGGTTSTLDEEPYYHPTSHTAIAPQSHEPPTKILKTSTAPMSTRNIAIARNNSTTHGMKLNSYTVGASYGPHPVKVVILGCASVGKASFVNRNVKGGQVDNRSTTEIVFKTMLLKNSNVTFQIVVCIYIYLFI
jgi:hypothetical protein